MTHIVFLTLGSQGDLQPLIVLAAHAKRHLAKDDTITIVSPEDLQAPYQHVLEDSDLHGHGLSVPSSPAVNGEEEQRQARQIECKALWDACQALEPTLIVITTFTLEGWSISERLKVPCVVVSLFLVDLFAIPSKFASAMATEMPDVYGALKNKPLWWKHVSYWMWRMFLDDHGDFRESLDLDPIPNLKLETVPSPLLYGIDSQLCKSSDPSVARMLGFWMDPDILKAMCAPLWDDIMSNRADNPMVLLWNFIQQAHSQQHKLVHVNFGSMFDRHPRLRTDVVYLKKLISAINTAALQQNASVVWIVGSTVPQTLKVCQQIASTTGEGRVYVYPQMMPNDFLLRLMLYGTLSTASLPLSFDTWWKRTRPCAASIPELAKIVSIHHGGAGTFGCMAYYGLPQVIMPLMFDQPYWADKAATSGLGKHISLAQSTDQQQWNDALRWAFSNTQEEVQLRKQWQADVQKTTQQGLQESVHFILSKIDTESNSKNA